MSNRKILLGTACFAAVALAAGPASADTLTGFAGFAKAEFQHQNFESNPRNGSVDGMGTTTFGIGGALPVEGISNMNVQIDASYGHSWTNDYTHSSPNFCSPPSASGPSCGASYADSRITWNFGLSPFWAYAGSRWGFNLNYETLTGLGHYTNGGGFMEWYVDDMITVAAKAGYISAGGTPQGGHGHYIAVEGLYYFMPNLAVSASLDWNSQWSGGTLVNSTALCRQNCALGYGSVLYTLQGEWLASEDYGVSVVGSFTYTSDNFAKQDYNTQIWRIGLKYYTGSGNLVSRHRDGVLRDFLRKP